MKQFYLQIGADEFFRLDHIKGWPEKIISNLAKTVPHDIELSGRYNFHYQAALNATPEWGEAYTEWASMFESDGSSTIRRKAIEVLERGLGQPFLEEGKWMRVRILEQLIYRCTKERRTENLDEYKRHLIELRLTESRR